MNNHGWLFDIDNPFHVGDSDIVRRIRAKIVGEQWARETLRRIDIRLNQYESRKRHESRKRRAQKAKV